MTLNFFRKSVSLTGLLFVILSANNQAFGETIIDICKPDIAKHCSDVTKGAGHVLACLYAHEDKLTDGCEAATSLSSVLIDSSIGIVEDTVIECKSDIEKYCSEAATGGEVLQCLKKEETNITSACKTGVEYLWEHKKGGLQ